MGSLNDAWRSGATTLGAWIMLRDPFAAEVAALTGYDYVCIDLQHGLATNDDVLVMVQAVARTSAVPIVRVASNDEWLIGRALDAGAGGVIVPLVNTAAEAAAAVTACRYPPDGTRSVGPIVPVNRHGSSYVTTANALVSCIPMIETAEGLANIDEILSVPGIDAIYVGPSDLSMRLGLPGRIDQTDPSFRDALERIVASCRAHGVVPGIHASADLTGVRARAGFRMITVGFDTTGMFTAFKADLATARAAAGS